MIIYKEHPGLRLANGGEGFFAGLVSFEPVKGDLRGVVAECEARRIRFAGNAQRMRIATHLFTQPAELQSFFAAVKRGLARK